MISARINQLSVCEDMTTFLITVVFIIILDVFRLGLVSSTVYNFY